MVVDVKGLYSSPVDESISEMLPNSLYVHEKHCINSFINFQHSFHSIKKYIFMKSMCQGGGRRNFFIGLAN